MVFKFLRIRSALLYSLFFLLAALQPPATAFPLERNPETPDSLYVDFTDYYLTLRVEGRDVNDVLLAISERTGVKILLANPLSQEISIRFERKGLTRGLKEIVAELGPGEFQGRFLLGPTLRESTYVIRKVSADETALRKEHAKQLTTQGERHLADGNDYRALGAFVKALVAEPAYVPAHVNLARIYQRWRDYPRLIKRLHRIIDLEPDNPRNYQWIAEAYARDYQREKALEYCGRLTVLSRDVSRVLHARELTNHLKIEAIKSYFAKITAARSHIREKEYDLAAAVLSEALELDPLRPKGYELLALVHEAQRDYVRAIEARERIAALDPEDTRNLFALGVDYRIVGDQEGARGVFEGIVNASCCEYFRLLAEKEIRVMDGDGSRIESVR